MRNLLLDHTSFLLTTDLEPDDVIAISQLFISLSGRAKATPLLPLKLSILVGEGDAAIKAAAMQALIDKFCKLGYLSNVQVNVIQDYSHFLGSQKDFANDGKAILTAEQIQLIKTNHNENHELTLQKIKEFLTENAKTLVLAMKPVREFMEMDPGLFAPHSLAAYGSYNFKAIWHKSEPGIAAELKLKLCTMLRSFHQSFVYERSLAVEETCYSMKKYPELFASILKSEEGSLLHIIKSMMNYWNNHLLELQSKGYPRSFKKYEGAGVITAAENKEFLTVLEGPFDQVLFERLSAVVKNKLSQYADDYQLRSVAQDLQYTLNLWENLNSCHIQFVNADADFMCVVTGLCEDRVSAARAEIFFDGDKTNMHAPLDITNTYLFLPGKETTVVQYQQWAQELKTAKIKPEAMKLAQQELSATIRGSLLAMFNKIALLEMMANASVVSSMSVFNSADGSFQPKANTGLDIAANLTMM